MADRAPPPPAETVSRFLTFRVAHTLYALPAREISEVIRVPAVARVPQGPKGLMGMANLRGAVLPVASLRALLGHAEAAAGPAARAIVLDGAAPVAVAVDAVDTLVSLDSGQVETRQHELAAGPGERLRGAFQAAGQAEVAKILDIAGLLAAAFVPRARPNRTVPAGEPAAPSATTPRATPAEAAAERMLVSFEVAGQEFALDLDAVREIVPAPDAVARLPHAEALVLGMTAYRRSLLPLLSLRGLLGLGADGQARAGQHADGQPADWQRKVIVVAVAGMQVGLLADRMRAILRAEVAAIDPVPPVLAARTGGEARLAAIYRAEGGARLVSILAPDLLFREDVMRRIGEQARVAPAEAGEAATQDEIRVLVFRLGDEEFALPIAAVDEVAQVPDAVTRISRTPKFLEGVVNLDGEVLPVIDQRRRFDMPAFEGRRQRRRLIVVRSERHRAGLIVDSVSEVLRAAADAVEPAPDLAGETARLVHGVINLPASGRMLLLLDPAELLSRSERGLLDAFAARVGRPGRP